MQLLTKLYLLALLLVVSVSSYATVGKKVLMVISGNGQSQGQEQPGFEFDELSKAYLTFTSNGITVDIASPNGGKVEADKYDPAVSYNKEFSANTRAMAKLQNSLSFAELVPASYDGIFVVGGKGAMFDLPNNSQLQQLIAGVYQSGGSIGAVCHGPAALVNVKLDNGKYLVAGKTVNGFTNTEEQLFGKKWLDQFEFKLEDKLKARGGQFQHSPMMLSHVAIDERLVTGQNPSSTVDTVVEMIKSLGVEVQSIPQYQDDLTLKLVAKIIAGDQQAKNDYQHNHQQYQTPLVGMYGYYAMMVADTDELVGQALTLMKLAQVNMQHPQLGLQIAKAQQRLGKLTDAKVTLEALIANDPNFEPAKQLLATL